MPPEAEELIAQIAELAPPPRVFVLGQVGRPGKVKTPQGEDLDLLSAVAMAGGFTKLAHKAKILVRRRNSSGNVEQITLDASKMAERIASSFILMGDDVITVHESVF